MPAGDGSPVPVDDSGRIFNEECPGREISDKFRGFSCRSVCRTKSGSLSGVNVLPSTSAGRWWRLIGKAGGRILMVVLFPGREQVELGDGRIDHEADLGGGDRGKALRIDDSVNVALVGDAPLAIGLEDLEAE